MIASIQERDERMARYAKAIGHPTRVAILKFLAARKDCFFGEIHNELPIAKSTVSQHLSELKDSGLIQGEIIPPKVKYCINRENWLLAQELLNEMFESYQFKRKCCSEAATSY